MQDKHVTPHPLRKITTCEHSFNFAVPLPDQVEYGVWRSTSDYEQETEYFAPVFLPDVYSDEASRQGTRLPSTLFRILVHEIFFFTNSSWVWKLFLFVYPVLTSSVSYLLSSAANIVCGAYLIPSHPPSVSLPSVSYFQIELPPSVFYSNLLIFGLNVHNIVQKPEEL